MIPITQGARLLHLAGFGTGIVLYAMLGMMALRSARTPGRRRDQIPIATSVLGLLWNLGAIALYGLRDLGLTSGRDASPVVLALGTLAFSALGFLPAVIVHAALLGNETRSRRTITGAAYTLSSLAAALQVWGALTAHVVPTRVALQFLSGGYALVLVVLAFVLRRQPGGRGPLTAAALAAFAVMALHLSHHVGGSDAVGTELWGHHASIPLAVVILYQDFRFALADLFLKRALVAVLLVSAGLLAHVLVVAPIIVPRLRDDPADPVATVLLLALWGAAAISAWLCRRAVWLFVDRVVLRRPDYRALRERFGREIARIDDASLVLDAARDRIGGALGATSVQWTEEPDSPEEADPRGPVSLMHRGSAAIVAVPTVEAPRFRVVVDGLPAGRRLLSDDVALLEAVTAAAGRRIDATRVAHERLEREVREQSILRLATEAELRALRAQLNPHFLFNALTTIGYLVQTSPERALATLYRLTDLLRAVLRPSAGELVPLSEEIGFVSAYLAIERARFEERLRVTIDVSEDAGAIPIPPLLLQPLVENAVKHGIAPLRAGGDVVIRARIEGGDDGVRRLHVSVADSGAGSDPVEFQQRREDGVGVRSVERRLEHHYGRSATMQVRTTRGVGTSIELWVPLHSTQALDGSPMRAASSDEDNQADVNSDRASQVRAMTP